MQTLTLKDVDYDTDSVRITKLADESIMLSCSEREVDTPQYAVIRLAPEQVVLLRAFLCIEGEPGGDLLTQACSCDELCVMCKGGDDATTG